MIERVDKSLENSPDGARSRIIEIAITKCGTVSGICRIKLIARLSAAHRMRARASPTLITAAIRVEVMEI